MFTTHPVAAARLFVHDGQHDEAFGDWELALPEDVYETGAPVWKAERQDDPGVSGMPGGCSADNVHGAVGR